MNATKDATDTTAMLLTAISLQNSRRLFLMNERYSGGTATEKFFLLIFHFKLTTQPHKEILPVIHIPIAELKTAEMTP